MKTSAGRSRAKPPARRKPQQTAALTRMVVGDALRSWVVPTVAIVAGVVIFVIYNIGLIESDFAVTWTGTLALVLILFFGLRSFTAHAIDGRLGAVLGGFVVLWSVATFYPFYRDLNPGDPLFTTTLNRNGTPATLPLGGKPGHYNLMVQGHFTPVEGKQNRTAAYRLTVGREGAPDEALEGTFHQEWRSQRIGAGRRSTLIPVMTQSTQVVSTLDDLEGRDLTVRLTELSPGVGDTVTLKLYPEGLPKLLLIALGVLAVVGAVVVDAFRPGKASEGLMGTLTLATLVSIAVFRLSSTATPGFPQFIIAALVGTLVGALGGGLLWRLGRVLKKRLPATS